MNISIPGDRAVLGYSGVDSSTVLPSGAGLSARGTGPSVEDCISVTPVTQKIQASLSTFSAAQTTRISNLRTLTAAGYYQADASKIAQSLVAGAAFPGTGKL